MAVSFVLRLLPEALVERRIEGRVEAVQTGEQVSVRDLEGLLGFLYGHVDAGWDGTEGLAGPAGKRSI